MNSSMGKKVTPLRQENKFLKTEKEAANIVKNRKSLRNFNERDLAIELGATTDSIMASRPRNEQLYTKKEKERMGNEAANKTRKVNKAGTTVERGSTMNPKTGQTDTYKRKPVAKQMKSPVKQMETINKVVSKAKEIGSKVGSAISSANEAGKKSYDKSLKGESFWGGSGAKRTYSKNPVEYVKGFVSDLASDNNPKTKEKKKTPAKQIGKKAPMKMKKC